METKGLTALRINLASPETIKSWSYGEVLKPETINYRRLRPEKDGLFCEAIFGPTRNWQCYCGKYKNPRYKGLTCDKCGVEVTHSNVRRERMGHIELATPIAHIWYTRRIPSYLGLLLDISRRNLDRVLYFAQYIVTYVDEDARQKALKKLADEISVSETERGNAVNAQIAEVKLKRDASTKELTAKKNAIIEKYDELTGQRLDPVIKEGQALEASLQERMGTVASAPIVFKASETVIADAGVKISGDLLKKIQKLVKAHLDMIENELKDQKERELEHVKMEIEAVKAEADLAMEHFRNQLEDQLKENKTHSTDQKDELQELKPFTFLSETRYRELKTRWGQVFRADMGAEAFYDILRRLDLNRLSEELWHEVRHSNSKQKKKKATTRLKVVEAFRRSGNRPEWMILTILPVIPPDLRPMVQLDGGRFATSDLNDLYRRVINRNNRLKRLLELGAPDVIVRNEKRMLQEAVDSLIDNSQRGKALSRRGRRELKSLSDMLKGKKGRFRRNLLGKRVDYSGRSVIVVGPQLKLYQCGLPKAMALELYKPFVVERLVSHKYVLNVRSARKYMEKGKREMWETLEEVISDRPVLLNRAPTLHRLGIQAFEPILIEGSAIQLHPLVTTAFNADFDGDQMAVHVPLSSKAVEEARRLMLASKNLLKPADGEPIISPSKDMVLGVYYLTMEPTREHKGDQAKRVFADMDEVEMAYALGQVEIHTRIKVRLQTCYDKNNNRIAKPETRLIETTVGRVIFNRILPEEICFVNWQLDKGGVKDLVADVYDICGQTVTTEIADLIKDIGFKYAMISGSSIAMADITIPPEKDAMIAVSLKEVETLQEDYQLGYLTELEKDERVIHIWRDTTKRVGDAVKNHMDKGGNIAIMALSGATKGGFGPISQIAGMRGVMADPSGRIIPLPILSNFREGLTALEYFISTHGSRKGLADTALRTADAGYLTRRLVDIAQDLIINVEDCGTTEGIIIRADDKIANQTMADRLYGRLTAAIVADPKTGEVILENGAMLDRDAIRKVEKAGVREIKVHSPLCCELTHGICQKCYGMDLARGQIVELGAAVGTVAAQSIGEPGTQLTLRTFQAGGVATSEDITTGLPRVEELFEARRMPKGEAKIASISGTAHISQNEKMPDLRIVHIESSNLMSVEVSIPEGAEVLVQAGTAIEEGTPVIKSGDAVTNSPHAGRVRIEDKKVIVSYDQKDQEEIDIPSTSRLIIKEGDHVEAGQPITEGSQNPHMILQIKGRDACQKYLLSEIQDVYRNQGQNINDKHFEVIIRKMLGKVQIRRPGDTQFLPMDLVDRIEIQATNEKLAAEGKQVARYAEILLGVSKASLSTDSFLSAASFQHTIKVLAGAAIASTEDPLIGLKENVIIGKLIPAGSGFDPAKARLLQGWVEPKLDLDDLQDDNTPEIA